MHLETVFLQSLELDRHIQTIEFYEGPPQYMAEVQTVLSIESARFSLESLSLVYRQLRAH